MAHLHDILPSSATSTNLLDLTLEFESYLGTVIVHVQFLKFCSLPKRCNIPISSQRDRLVTRGHK